MMVRSLLFLFSIYLFASQDLIRGARCGLYFAKANDTHGDYAAPLEVDAVAEAIRNHHFEQTRVILNGVSMDEARGWGKKLRSMLDEAGYKNVPTTVIRKLESFVHEQTGIFHLDADLKSYVKVPANADLSSYIEELPDEQKHFVVAGMPKIVVDDLKNKVPHADIEETSKTQLYANKAWNHPLQALRHGVQKLRYFLPLGEDLVAPTTHELQATVQRVVVPAVITFSVLVGMGQELWVAVPVTITNGANSAVNGAFRSSFGNWFRRSSRFFPDQLIKNLMITTFYTMDVYWSGQKEKIVEIVQLAGWTTFFSHKWISILFNAGWRAPLSAALFKWEHEKSIGEDLAYSHHMRRQASAIEKYMSYVMTQFFIYSLVTEQSLFKIVYNNGLNISTQTDATGVMMDANAGHIAMAGVGLIALLAQSYPKILDFVAGVALRLDEVETRWTNAIFSPLFSWWNNLRKGDSK